MVAGLSDKYRYYEAKEVKSEKSSENVGIGKMKGKQELDEAKEMTFFKKEFYQELSKITTHSSLSNAAVNISEKAFENMKADPEYREQVLSLIARDFGSSVAPRQCSLLITVGATLDDYRGDSWPDCNDSEFRMRSKDSFYKKTNNAKKRQKEIWEAYLEKRMQAKKLRQKLWDESSAVAETHTMR